MEVSWPQESSTMVSFCDWRLTEAINNSVGTSYFILDVEVELL
jgi:hypothetical protein